MATTKIYPATQTQAQTIIAKVNEFDAKVSPVDLSTVVPLILDFVNDDITIIHGTLDINSRTFSN